MIVDKRLCRYCQSVYTEGSKEHVFPKGLGGPNIFMDNVCENCNRKFSDFERELMRDSPVAFMRSVEGVEGYKRPNIPVGALLAPILLTIDEETKVVYEVGQRYPFENFLRPQIIYIDRKFYIEGHLREDLEKLDRKFAHWKKNNRVVVVKTWLQSVGSLNWIEFVENGASYSDIEKPTGKINKEVIKIDLLTDNHELYPHLSPRIFLNDLGELRVRAKSVQEAIIFLMKLMHHTRVSVSLNSYKKDALANSVIYVGQNFNNLQVLQCVIKIGINCLMHFYPSFKDDSAFNDCISFVMTGTGDLEMNGEERDNIKDAGKETHNIFFQQTTRGVHVRIGFFNGSGGAYCFLIDNLMLMEPGEFTRLVIYYRKRTMQLQSRTEFLLSFNHN